jgi:hypothetical protein
MLLDMHWAKRYGAKTRRGKPCHSPAMANGRCRMHGGPSLGAPKGNRNAFKHGRHTTMAIAQRREISALIRAARDLESRLPLAVACSSEWKAERNSDLNVV